MTAPTADRAGTGRVIAIDIARFIALAGMFAAHTWNRNEDGSHTLIGELVAGRAAALFAVLAGVGIALVTRRFLADGQPGRARRMLVGRGAALLAIGLTLGVLSTNVFVIIAYYGVLFWVMALVVGLRDRWLIVVAAISALVGPPVNVAVRHSLGIEYEVGTPDWLDLADPIALLRGLAVTGIYPALTWIVYGIVGLLIGRALLRASGAAARRTLGLKIAGLGAASAALGAIVSALALDVFGGREALAAGYLNDGPAIVDVLLTGSGEGAPLPGSPWWFFAAIPHTGTTPDLLLTAGIAAFVIGVLLALLPDPSRAVQRILLPIAGAGAIPLTVYSVHVTLTAIVPEVVAMTSPSGVVPYEYDSGPVLWLAHVVVALLLGTLFALIKVRGPFETVVTAVGRFAARPLRTRRTPAR
ncbi:heparan-alpha-glucosaminide N-acetyltransferase domain-containing protein [Amnibacterium flavum]|uniref:Uncharacterized protein n=1 Tax=Amnibacterium flavum TaxID=2173173 RepID=A0A2V1HXZ7_9MICO|nr:heparan-alpha-glucosaminide N-acetyltransferase domain-containing protein [Amnibacterium flavum]PVZ95264.1 hypothetical protein DDQ50_01695 [Amnibacterium flavum]